MASYASVQAFAKRCDTELPTIDIVILNAGIFQPTFNLDPTTGHELTIQVNYLSTFLLAILLMPILTSKATAGKPARLTVVNSGVSLGAQLPNRNKVPLLASFDDTNIQPFDMTERYYSSKVLGQLFTARLAEYLPSTDKLIFNLVDPGLCKGSDLHRDIHGVVSTIVSSFKTATARTLEAGASTYVDAVVTKGPESQGSFIFDWQIHP
jgi:NAD(P)-dependent dehydrogenase (short-subunit alcohol dehydrogenase family)